LFIPVTDLFLSRIPDLQQCLYYRERKESINPQLLALEKKKKIIKPPSLGRAQINQLGNFGRAQINPPRQFWARTYQSARQLWARPYQSVRQQTTNSTLHLDFPSPPHIAWGSLLLFVCTADLSSLSHQGQQRPTHPSTPLGYGGLGLWPLASVWTFGDHPGSQTEVRIKHDFTSVPESFWLWRKLHQKVQLFQREGGGMLYWPACWVAYKRKSWRAWTSVSSQ
jgi:hypothetical protein